MGPTDDLFSRKRYRLPAMALTALVTFALFSSLLRSGFINFDDPAYVTSNSHIRSGVTLQGIAWAFTQFYSYNWHPLTWVSHMLDVSLFGFNPAGHHLTSLLLHLANTLLLFSVLRLMTGAGWRSLVVALLFALHPLHVESVAWVAERKDVLSTLFWLLAMRAYLDYVERPGSARYFLVLFLFGCGLMAKPMVVTLPIILLLLDYWPLERSRPFIRLLLEKVPFILLSATSAAVTFIAQQREGAITPAPFSANVANALIAYIAYLGKTVWPVRLAVYYPLHPEEIHSWQIACAALTLVAITALVLWQRNKRPYLAAGWFWYLVTLAPVSGLVRIGGGYTMADRYTYVPLIGIFVAAVWGGAELASKARLPGKTLIIIACVVMIPLSFATWHQVRYWRDSVTLFEHAVDVTHDNRLAQTNLASALMQQGNFSGALPHVAESLRLFPDPEVYVSQGWIYLNLGDLGRAAESCRMAISMVPDRAKAHYLLGLVYLARGDRNSALGEADFLKKVAPGLAEELGRRAITPDVGHGAGEPSNK